MKPRRVPYEQFQREVRALLTRGQGVSKRQASSWLRRYWRYVRSRWAEGKPPCSVADHLAKYEREAVLRPRRDADNPEVGEIFETKKGNLWEVVSRSDDRKRIDVRRAGHRVGSSNLRWSTQNFKGLKFVKKKELESELKAATEAQRLAEGGQLALPFHGRQMEAEKLFASDPEGRGGKKKSERPKYIRCPRKTVIQQLVFWKRSGWTPAKAKAWAKKHGFRFARVESLDTTIRVTQARWNPKLMFMLGYTKREYAPGVRALVACPRSRAKATQIGAAAGPRVARPKKRAAKKRGALRAKAKGRGR